MQNSNTPAAPAPPAAAGCSVSKAERFKARQRERMIASGWTPPAQKTKRTRKPRREILPADEALARYREDCADYKSSLEGGY